MRISRLLVVVLVTWLALAAPAGGSQPARSEADTASGTVLVRFRGDPDQVARALVHADTGGRPVGRVHGLPVVVVRVPRGTSPAALARMYRRMPGVAWAEPNRRVRAADAPLPEDPLFGQQHALQTIDAPEGWAAAGMSLPLWVDGAGVALGIIDSGIDLDHVEFEGRIAGCVHSLEADGMMKPGCNDGLGHGTHVTGIAGAATNDGAGVAGVSFASPLLICRALNDRGLGWSSDVAGCVGWLHEHGAKVINMSLVGAEGLAMRAAVEAAWHGGASTGSVLLAAAGNSHDTACEYPACYEEVVSVAATRRTGAHPFFSTSNPDVEVSAPGVSVLSALPGGYGRLTGTSMAAPHASAVAAVTWQENPSFTAAEVRTRLREGVEDLGDPGHDPLFGYGRVSLCASLGPVCSGQGPDGRITGTVTRRSGAPLRARVVVVSGPEEAATRSSVADGSYELASLTPGVYRIKARRSGCVARLAWVWLPGGTEDVDFVLAC